MLFAGARQQQDAARALGRLADVDGTTGRREPGADLAQHALQPTETERDVGEVAAVLRPHFAQPMRGRREQFDEDGLDRHAARQMRLDGGERLVVVGGAAATLSLAAIGPSTPERVAVRVERSISPPFLAK
ncbi:MAG: hypothetical protein MUE62_00985 [Burkholderiaceae bacterium]|nr:hypothetical protein [Burkholderiaceae bacterium]